MCRQCTVHTVLRHRLFVDGSRDRGPVCPAQATTVLNRQPLVCPQQLHLSPMEDLALRCAAFRVSQG